MINSLNQDKKIIAEIFTHELGHLCTDILICAKFPEFEVKNLNIEYSKNRTPFEWYGFVFFPKPPLEKLLNNIPLTTLNIISFYSGCILELVFLKKFFNSNKELKDCLGLKNKCRGKEDLRKVSLLTSELRKKFLNAKKLETIKFVEIETPIILQDIFGKPQFLEDLKVIIDQETNKIYESFVRRRNPNRFTFKYKNDRLHKLILELSDILKKSNKTVEITSLQKKICQLID